MDIFPQFGGPLKRCLFNASQLVNEQELQFKAVNCDFFVSYINVDWHSANANAFLLFNYVFNTMCSYYVYVSVHCTWISSWRIFYLLIFVHIGYSFLLSAYVETICSRTAHCI
jgi:hypothetical protein